MHFTQKREARRHLEIFFFLVFYFQAVESKVLNSSLIPVCSLFRSCLLDDLIYTETTLSHWWTVLMGPILLIGSKPNLGVLFLIVLEFHRFPLVLFKLLRLM